MKDLAETILILAIATFSYWLGYGDGRLREVEKRFFEEFDSLIARVGKESEK